MRLADYYRGERLTFRSRLSPGEVQDRINGATQWSFMPVAAGVYGSAWFGHLRLRYRTSWLRNPYLAIMAGAIRPDGAGSRLELRYRAPGFLYLAPIMWLLTACLVLLFAVLLAGSPDAGPVYALFPLAIGAVAIGVPVIQLRYALVGGDEAREKILDFLRQATDAAQA